MSNSPIRRIVLHYSATYPDQDLGVADIDKMHRARGFNSVGYHYVIKRDGTVQKGRADHTVGAHVAGHNTGSLGICCIGGLERASGPNVGVDTRTEAQKAATIRLVRELLAKHPGAEVVGHRDLGATQCPGFDVRSWWATVSARPPVIDAAPPIPAVALPSRRAPSIVPARSLTILPSLLIRSAHPLGLFRALSGAAGPRISRSSAWSRDL